MRLLFVLLWSALLILALAAMWWGWRARTRRDRGVTGAALAPSGALLARFGATAAPDPGGAGGVHYVSTTPVGEPLTRVAAPGLRYRGPAEIEVRADGVTITVVGEDPVHLSRAQIAGAGSASRRVGKAVEAGGLALLRWRSGERDLESSFRFAERSEQQRFAAALERLAGDPPAAAPVASTPLPPSTSQEDAQ